MSLKIFFVLHFLFLFLFLPKLVYSKSLVVLNFENKTAKSSLDFFSFLIPETINHVVTKDQVIDSLEREKLGEILKEAELQQSGLIDLKVLEKIKLLKADFLVFGFYQETVESEIKKISINMRIVEVSSGKIIFSDNIAGDLSEIFSKIESSTTKMLALIKGEELVPLNVFSYPIGAKVYLDGILVGKTPLFNYPVSKGRAEIILLKDNYQKHTQELIVDSSKKINLEINLFIQKQFDFSLGYYYFRNLTLDLEENFLLGVRVGYRFSSWQINLEYLNSLAESENSYYYEVPYDQQEDQRDYIFQAANLSFVYYPLKKESKIFPYCGLTAGYWSFWEKNINYEFFGRDEDRLNSISWGLLTGIKILPSTNASLFFEFRYLGSLIKAEREVVDRIDFGLLNKKKEKMDFSALMFGGGFSLNIDWRN